MRLQCLTAFTEGCLSIYVVELIRISTTNICEAIHENQMKLVENRDATDVWTNRREG